MTKPSALLFFSLWLASVPVGAVVSAALRELPPDPVALRDDLALILDEAKFPSSALALQLETGSPARVRLECRGTSKTLRVRAPAAEQAATFYYGLRQLGFLFPHPRWQISPKGDFKRACGKEWTWEPVLRYRGFHLHTLHPNEWVHGFQMDKPEIALQYVRWLARNGQNVFQLALLRQPLPDIARRLKDPFQLARGLGVHAGVSIGVALQQQKSYKLLPLWQAVTGWGAEDRIRQGMRELFDAVDVSFLTLEAGTSEFTSTDYEETLRWLNAAAEEAKARGKPLFTKVHVSSNQHDPKWGNYNFIPAYADPWVGVLPHTVMFYGLLDKLAPMYGNRDFSAIRRFTLQQNDRRPTWYYPETGYWVGMDVDIPLFLTDYLATRAEDLRWLVSRGVEGQITFSTGHGLGGWLFDWNLALLTDKKMDYDPLAGVKLLGEDAGTWQRLLAHQREWFKRRGLIAELSAANIQDELTTRHRIHHRYLLRELAENPAIRRERIGLLREALAAWPEELMPRHPELASLARITRLRLGQALALREALSGSKASQLARSQELRQAASELLLPLKLNPLNYPDASVFERHPNPTSYQYGYLWPAATLHFWRREEGMVAKDSYFPFQKNIYNLWDILF